MSQEYQIRQGTFQDAPELARLRWECAGRKTAGETFEAFADQFTRFLNEAFCRNNWNVWVAEQEGRLVGLLFVHHVLRVPSPGQTHDRWGQMTEMVVAPGMDAQEVGAEMVSTVMDWAHEQGLEALRLWPGDEATALYSQRGFVRAGEALELAL